MKHIRFRSIPVLEREYHHTMPRAMITSRLNMRDIRQHEVVIEDREYFFWAIRGAALGAVFITVIFLVAALIGGIQQINSVFANFMLNSGISVCPSDLLERNQGD